MLFLNVIIFLITLWVGRIFADIFSESYTNKWHDYIQKFIGAIKEKYPKELAGLETTSADFIKDRKESKLENITKTVGNIEYYFFSLLLIFLVIFGNKIYSEVITFLQIFGGWLTIKTIIHYDQWNHKVAGKSYFYVSLLGTLINIFSAIVTAIFIIFLINLIWYY